MPLKNSFIKGNSSSEKEIHNTYCIFILKNKVKERKIIHRIIYMLEKYHCQFF